MTIIKEGFVISFNLFAGFFHLSAGEMIFQGFNRNANEQQPSEISVKWILNYFLWKIFRRKFLMNEMFCEAWGKRAESVQLAIYVVIVICVTDMMQIKT